MADRHSKGLMHTGFKKARFHSVELTLPNSHFLSVACFHFDETDHGRIWASHIPHDIAFTLGDRIDCMFYTKVANLINDSKRYVCY